MPSAHLIHFGFPTNDLTHFCFDRLVPARSARSSLEESYVVAFQSGRKRPAGGEEPRPRLVVAVGVDRGHVLVGLHPHASVDVIVIPHLENRKETIGSNAIRCVLKLTFTIQPLEVFRLTALFVFIVDSRNFPARRSQKSRSPIPVPIVRMLPLKLTERMPHPLFLLGIFLMAWRKNKTL